MLLLRKCFAFVLFTCLLFTSCKKDGELTELSPNTPITSPQQPTPANPSTINEATTFRALAAAAKTSQNTANGLTEEENPCGCYDLFKDIDFEASDAEVDAAIEAALAALSEEEITRIFEPVCTDNGEIIESACVADCQGVTNYHICSDDELEDYFFEDFECEDLDSLSFPFELDLPDGTVITVNNEEELFAAFENWYEEHGDDYEDHDEWGEEWEHGDWDDEDWDDEDWDDYEECYTIVYPVSINFPDGTSATYNSDEELYKGIETWYEANLESNEEPMPVYPITIMLQDSTTQTINNDAEIEALDKECYGDYEEDICFDIVFPMTITNLDSTTVVVNTEDELEDALEAIFDGMDEEDIDEASLFAVLFPFDIQYEDGTIATISTIEDLEIAVFNCFGFGLQEAGGVKGLLSNTTDNNNSFLLKRKSK